MLTRRAALMGAAGIAASPLIVKAASGEEIMDTSMAPPADLSTLQRIKHKLVKPPFVHEHEQVAHLRDGFDEGGDHLVEALPRAHQAQHAVRAPNLPLRVLRLH